MQVFCPNCGQPNETRPDGGKVMCTACMTVFEPPGPPPPPPARHVVPPPPPPGPPGYAPPPPPPPTGAGFQPPPAPYVPPAQYGQPTTAQSGPMSQKAIISLVAGILCCIPVVAPAVAIYFGLEAIKEVDATPGLQGRPLAVAGIVLGALGLLGTIGQVIAAIISR